MGKVVMTRVDARLIHGQVAARWTNHLNATKIVVIDDDTAKDKLLIELFRVAAPMGTNVRVYSIDQGIAAWQKDEFGAGKIIVIFKTVDTCLDEIEPTEIVILLDILGVLTSRSCEEYSFLKDHKSLLINCTCKYSSLCYNYFEVQKCLTLYFSQIYYSLFK